jgi:hypothetical protein
VFPDATAGRRRGSSNPTVGHGSPKVVNIMGRTERAQALFVSHLQPSQQPPAHQVAAAIEESLRRFGPVGCAAATAAEYGDHPETAASRMRWALALSALLEPLAV